MFTKHAKSHGLNPQSKMMKVINPHPNIKIKLNSTNPGSANFVPTILRKAPDIQIAPKPVTGKGPKNLRDTIDSDVLLFLPSEAAFQSFRIINVTPKIAPKNKIRYIRPANINTIDAEQKIVSEKTPSETTQNLFRKNDSFKIFTSESAMQSSSNDPLISSAIVCPHNNNLQP